MPRRCRIDSWDPHGVPKDLLIKIVVFVCVICKNSENAIHLSKKNNNGAVLTRQLCGIGAAAARHSLHAALALFFKILVLIFSILSFSISNKYAI
jgi:hypothetical protein